MSDMVFIFIAMLSEGGVINHCKASIPRVVFNDFVQIFHLDKKGDLPQTQCADASFKDRLKEKGQVLKEQIKTSRGFLKFLESIPDNQYFLVYGSFEDIEFELSDIMKITNNLYKLNNIDAMYYANEQLETNYYVKCYWQGKSKVFIGSNTNRKCRFCEKSSTEVSFKKKAHAISNALGNNTIFCNEECDICNEKFGETIEMEFYNTLAPIYSLYAVRGKNNKARKYKYNSLEINSQKVLASSTFQLPSIEEVENKGFVDCYKGGQYIPQNVYKCLCKFAINVIDAQYLPELRNTIQWINSSDMLSITPSIFKREVYSDNHPQIGFYINRNSSGSNIKFIFRLFLLGVEYVYTIPFDREGNIVSVDQQIREFLLMFWRGNEDIVNKYAVCDYSSACKNTVDVQINIKPTSRDNFVFLQRDAEE